MSKHHSSFLGRAGEFAVAAQLLVRGLVVHFPAVDTGVDLVIEGRIRVQVKSRRREPKRLSGYNFTLGAKRETGDRLESKLRAKTMAEVFPGIDFLICWGVEDNRFWILPQSVLSKFPAVQSMLLGANHRKFADYASVRDHLEVGNSQATVARHLNLHPVTVSAIARGRTSTMDASSMLSVEADKYEDAWDGIAEAVNITHQIDSGVAEIDREAFLRP